jgi:hypothetical protein
MKLTILLSSAILFATALTPMSAHAEDQNLMCNRSGNGCEEARDGSGKRSIRDSGISLKSSSSERKTSGKRDAAFNRNAETSPVTNHDDENDTVDTGNDVVDNDTGNEDNTVADNGNAVDAGNDNVDNGNADVISDAGNNTNPPQLNSNDVKGFDPFSGLYGPGT